MDIAPQLTDSSTSRAWMLLEVVLILALGLAAEAAHFSWRDGRPVLNGDSAQYVDAAEALLDSQRGPDFAVRKPGYPFILAAIALLTGNMSWAAVAANHLFQGFLPLAAYGLGRNLHSRPVGWVAAILTVAHLQGHILGGRIMSEAPYMCLLSFGALALAAALKHGRSLSLVATAGVLLALAWSIRSIAIVIIAASLVCTIWAMRHAPRRALVACMALILPVTGAAFFECGLNKKHSGQFRTSTGSFGLMLMMRVRHLQGLPMPDSEVGQRCLALAPNPDPQDAYRVAEVDAWMARYRAVHDQGMDDWQVDALMKRAALEAVTAHPGDFVRRSAHVFSRHLLRQKQSALNSGASHKSRSLIIDHPAGADDPDPQQNWYAYWGLPHRTLDASLDLAARMRAAAEQRAPFAWTEPIPTLRYVSMLPAVTDLVGVFGGVAALWPGFALLLCGPLGLNRRTCAFLAMVYVMEAMVISICCPSEPAAARYQSVWLATDSTLAAAFVAAPLCLARSRMRAGGSVKGAV